LIYFFLITFVFFLIIDYIYLYIFLDSKLFMKSSGSKLRYILNKKQNIKNDNFKFFILLKKCNVKCICVFILFITIMNFINLLLFKDIIFSNFIILDLGYKKIELISTFENYWSFFIKLYYLVYNVFLVVLFGKGVSIYIYKKDKKLLNQEKYKTEIYKNEIYIGKNLTEDIYLKKEELYKNLLITGSIGTGKTSSAINKFCKYMIENKISGLIIDIKGNYVDTVEKFIKDNRDCELIVISEDSNVKYNPIKRKVRSLEMANRLRRVLELVSVSNSSDSYWLDKVENVLFNLLVLIKYIDESRLDLKEIHRLITDDEYLKSNLEKLKNKSISEIENVKVAHEINNVIIFFSKEYFNLDKRVISIIKSEITRLTIPFVTEYDICDKFGTKHEEEIDMSFNEKKQTIYVLSINMSKNFLLSKMLATFIKLEFQSTVLENIQNPKERFCICDEYQEFANTQDAHFLSLSREAKCMNIYSMQSYSSLINILKNEQASKVIIQNLVNKIWFRNDDNYTIQEILKQIGQERKVFKTSTISEGANESKKTLFSGFKSNKSNISESISYAENNDYIFSANVISRELETFEALVLLGNDGKMSEIKRVKLKGRYDNETNKNNSDSINFVGNI